ncbi:hypothetical protein U1Q18_028406 [Sarracenia purpurea var. burkii]
MRFKTLYLPLTRLEEGCFSGIGGFRVAQNPEAARSGNCRNLLVVAKASREPQAAASTSPKPAQKTRAAAKCLPNKGFIGIPPTTTRKVAASNCAARGLASLAAPSSCFYYRLGVLLMWFLQGALLIV